MEREERREWIKADSRLSCCPPPPPLGGGVGRWDGRVDGLDPCPNTLSSSLSRAGTCVQVVYPRRCIRYRDSLAVNGGLGKEGKQGEKVCRCGGRGRGATLSLSAVPFTSNLLHAEACWVGRSWMARSCPVLDREAGGGGAKSCLPPVPEGAGHKECLVSWAGSAHQELAWSRAGSGVSSAGLGSGLRQHARAG
jgi:hypothetical protein